MRPTPEFGRSSRAAVMNSFPYFAVKCFLTSVSSGMSEHLGDAKTTLAIASFKSIGQFLQINSETQRIGNHFFTHF